MSNIGIRTSQPTNNNMPSKSALYLRTDSEFKKLKCKDAANSVLWCFLQSKHVLKDVSMVEDWNRFVFALESYCKQGKLPMPTTQQLMDTLGSFNCRVQIESAMTLIFGFTLTTHVFCTIQSPPFDSVSVIYLDGVALENA